MFNDLFLTLAAAATDDRNGLTKAADALPQWAIYLGLGIGIAVILVGVGYTVYLKKTGNWRTGTVSKKLK